MRVEAWNSEGIATEPLPGKSAVLQFADDVGLLPTVYDKPNIAMRAAIICHDAEKHGGTASPPSNSDAKRVLDFHRKAAESGVEYFIVQCCAGVGRSVAVCKALSEMDGVPYRSATYNRRLYRSIMTAAGCEIPPEPLVSITVRIKYEVEKLMLFLMSMRAQRWDNWEVVAFTDGPNPDAVEIVKSTNDPRIRVIETPKQMGRWGHPYRQMAFEQCNGEWIGTQNDDNYLVPGYIEQMVTAGEAKGADVVACQSLHRYSAWSAVPPGTDLCAWIAKAEVIHATPWTGTGFTADRDYLAAMMKYPGVVGVAVERPLVVKN